MRWIYAEIHFTPPHGARSTFHEAKVLISRHLVLTKRRHHHHRTFRRAQQPIRNAADQHA